MCGQGEAGSGEQSMICLSDLTQPASSTQVVHDASLEVPPPDMITEGGLDPVQRRCSFLELALCTAPGLDDNGLSTLLKV